MDDMAAKINGLLQDPEAMKQIQALAGMFSAGQNPTPETPPVQTAVPAAPQRPVPVREASAVPSLSPETMQMVMKLMPLISSMQQETDNTRFLHALRPLLSEKRQKKLDDAAHMMQLMQVLPMLKKGGIL